MTDTVDDEPDKPEPWWRVVTRLGWLLGVHRSTLQMRAFIDVVYVQAKSRVDRIPAMQPVIADLEKLRHTPDMPQAMACEGRFYELLPVDDLGAALWSLRERFARVASAAAATAFDATKIADVAHASDVAIRAEVRALLDYTHKSYELSQNREAAAGLLKIRLLTGTIVIIVVFAGLVFRFSDVIGITAPRSLAFGIGAIMLAGSAGAVMSIARRLQGAIDDKVLDRDPLFEIAALELGRAGIMLSCLIGAIFALMVYALILTGLGDKFGLTGQILLPVVQKDAMLGQATGISHALGFYGDVDTAKMLIFAFVSGFAERLVPDAIDRILKQRDDQAAKK